MVAQAVTIRKCVGDELDRPKNSVLRYATAADSEWTTAIVSGHTSLRSVRKVTAKAGRRATVNREAVSDDRQQAAMVNRVKGRAQVQRTRLEDNVDDDDRSSGQMITTVGRLPGRQQFVLITVMNKATIN